MTRLINASAIVLTAELALVLLGVDLSGQTSATKDEYQRSADIYGMRTSAPSGPQRGKEIWIDYMLPEPYSHNRRTWIDNSTNPVTVWYVDHNGYMVRIQPME